MTNWISQNATPFSPDIPKSLSYAIDLLLASWGELPDLLGLGEALHGGEEILLFRNRLFQHLVEVHGYSAIAIESSFPLSRFVNKYISCSGPDSYEEIQEGGFSHGFGRLEANRELVEWMRDYNADPSHPVKLRFYGFDSLTEMTMTASPRVLLNFVLKYLISVDSTTGQFFQARIDKLLGKDSDWENPAAMMDPARSVGRSPAAVALRAETEDLIIELHIRGPELMASGKERYAEAVQYASLARQMLGYHAVLGEESERRTARLLGMRDTMMADNLAYILSCEQGRGKVLAFAHNSHLKCGTSKWQLGKELLIWWAAGAHLRKNLGRRYAVIGTGIGVSEENGISIPEPGTIEASLTGLPGPVRYVSASIAKGSSLDVPDLLIRSASQKNSTYFPFTSQSFTDFDWLMVFDRVTYSRGGPDQP